MRNYIVFMAAVFVIGTSTASTQEANPLHGSSMGRTLASDEDEQDDSDEGDDSDDSNDSDDEENDDQSNEDSNDEDSIDQNDDQGSAPESDDGQRGQRGTKPGKGKRAPQQETTEETAPAQPEAPMPTEQNAPKPSESKKPRKNANTNKGTVSWADVKRYLNNYDSSMVGTPQHIRITSSEAFLQINKHRKISQQERNTGKVNCSKCHD